MNEAFRDWVTSVGYTHYCIGSVGGPHPFPMMVRDFQRVIGLEAREQVLETTGRLPDAVIACVGGGSNAIGIFHAFVPDAQVRLIGCEAGGDGPRHRAARGHAHRRIAGRAARHADVRAAGRRRPDARHPLHLGRPGLPGRRPGARLAEGDRPGRVPRGDRRRGDGRVRRCCAGPRASSRPSSPRTRWPARSRSAANSAPAGSSWSTCRAAATRTWTPHRNGSGCKRRDERGNDGLRQGGRRRPCRPGRLPPGRVPLGRRRHRGGHGHGRSRGRRHRGGPALLRPADGRPGDRGGGAARAGRRDPGRRRAPHRRGGRRIRACPSWS